MSEFKTPKCTVEGPYEGKECICIGRCAIYGDEGVCSSYDCKGPVQPDDCDYADKMPCMGTSRYTGEEFLEDEPDEFGLEEDSDIPGGY